MLPPDTGASHLSECGTVRVRPGFPHRLARRESAGEGAEERGTKRARRRWTNSRSDLGGHWAAHAGTLQRPRPIGLSPASASVATMTSQPENSQPEPRAVDSARTVPVRSAAAGATLTRQDATAVLRTLVGDPTAEFRDGQAEAVEALLARRRALVVQRTGWGKSAVYFVTTALLRAHGAGPTLIVSPLLALMRDQVAAAARAGIRAVTINSANPEEWGEINTRIVEDSVDVLLVSPERLNNPRFRVEQLPELSKRAGLVVVDEAHCISDWGHDFRPDYRRLRDLLTELPSDTPVLGTTATANARVVADVAEQLGAGGQQVDIHRGPLARDSLRLGVLKLPLPQQRLAWLAQHLHELPGSGIIYALTVSAAQDTAELLADAGHRVRAYTGRTDPAERAAAEHELQRNEVKALVATSALGMGFDKPDLGFVVHLGAPSSPIAYYQQVGRAGRATERADVLLLPGVEDREIWAYFASASMPRKEQAESVLETLAAATKPMSTAALETAVDIRRTRLELLLKVLDVDGAVDKVNGGWQATGLPWKYDEQRYDRVHQTRREESEAMLAYIGTDECRMTFLQRALDDPTVTGSKAPGAPRCGRCDVCAGSWYPTGVSAEAQDSAAERLNRAGVPIEPRAMWPSGMGRLGVDVRGKIPPEEQARQGRAIARFSDLGWGGRLRTVLQSASGAGLTDLDGTADDALLQASVQVLADWGWDRRPDAIVRMPSRRRDKLLASVAEHLARRGRLPLLGTLEYVEGGPTGQPGGNSAFRLAGVWGLIGVSDQLRSALQDRVVRDGSAPTILLVDDFADSRWTLTVAARELRLAGAGEVLPFVLASNG